jgi:hypothetical protein
MDAGAKMALYGSNPKFTQQFFGILGDLQALRLKAIGSAAAGRPAGAMSAEAARLLAVAEKTASLGPGGAAARLRELEAEDA